MSSRGIQMYMATTELRHCDRSSPVRLASKAVANKIAHHVKNMPWMPMMVLPTMMKSKVWRSETPAI